LAAGAVPQAPAERVSAARNVAAGAAVAVIVLQLACAQATLGLAVVSLAIGVIGRWRPSWLGCLALTGLAWAVVTGPGPAWAGYVAAGEHIISVLAVPGHPAGLAALTSGWQRWLPAQLPLALIAAAAQTWVALRFIARGHRRPGLLVAVRRRYVLATLRRGEVATADGGCLGVVASTGRRVAVTWREAAAGVLVTGSDAAAVTGTCLAFAAAAIVHRKAVIMIDLTDGSATDAQAARRGAATVPGSVAAVSRGAAAPATVFGQGRACYEPFMPADQAAAAELVAAMLDGREASPAWRDACADAVRSAFELRAARGAVPGTRVPGPASSRPSVLDDAAALLRQGSQGAAIADIAAQLTRLRRSPAGTPIRAASPAEEAIDLAQALARRQVVVFPLDLRQHGQAGIMVARLVIADLERVLDGRAGVPADALIWINGCEVMDVAALAALVACGARSGLATMLGTTRGPVAAALAGHVNVVVVRGQQPPGLAGQPAAPAGRTGSPLSGTTWPAGDAGVTGKSLLEAKDDHVLAAAPLEAGRADGLSLRVREPVPRLVCAGRVLQ
jgi:hypothetical protein